MIRPLKPIFLILAILGVTASTVFISMLLSHYGVVDNRAMAQSASGTLQCAMTSENSISLEFSFQSGTNVTIFRGDSSQGLLLGSGSGSGVRTNSRLSRGDTYTYYLRNGSTAGSTLLASVTCSTLGAGEPYWEGSSASTTVTGSITCAGSTTDSISLNYQFENGTDVTVWRDNQIVAQLGSGSRSGQGRNTNVQPGQYTYYLRNGNSSTAQVINSVICGTQGYEESSSADTGIAKGSLTCGETTDTYITLRYGFTNGTNVSIFRGDTNLVNLGSGNKTDQGRDKDLEPGKTYQYRLVNGTTVDSPTLDSVVCSTQGSEETTPEEDDATGGLTCGTATTNSISVRYQFENGTDASIYLGSSRIATLGSGDKTGSGKSVNLQPGQEYTYYLRNGISVNSPLLATVICSTLSAEGSSAESSSRGLTCSDEQTSSIKLTYDFSHNEEVQLYRNDDLMRTFSAGENKGELTDSSLQSNTPYTYTVYAANNKDVIVASTACFTKPSTSDLDTLPSAGQIQLPVCEFQDTAGVWAKNNNCPWTKRVRFGTDGQAACGLVGVTPLQIRSLKVSDSLPYAGIESLLTTGLFANSFNLCTTASNDFSTVPDCPQAFGTKGTVWVKSYLLPWSNDNVCQVGKDCEKNKGVSIGSLNVSAKVRTFANVAKVFSSIYTEVADTSVEIDIPGIGKREIDLKKDNPAIASICVVGGTSGSSVESAAQGSLSCGRLASDSIEINYSFENGTDVYLFRDGSVWGGIGQGSKTSGAIDRNLQSNRQYSYEMRDGKTTSSKLMASVTCRTEVAATGTPGSTSSDDGGSGGSCTGPEVPEDSTGSLSCRSEQLGTIIVDYTFTYDEAVRIYRDNTTIANLGSGTNIGSISDSGLEATTPYMYTLRPADDDKAVIASVTCFTKISDDDMESIPTDAKVQLPLCPFEGAPAVWAKHKRCPWDKRVEVGGYEQAGCGLLGIDFLWIHSGYTSGQDEKYPKVVALWLPLVQASAIDLCTTTHDDFSVLPACPEDFGPIGSVWAKPDLLPWTWGMVCQVGTNCFKDKSVSLTADGGIAGPGDVSAGSAGIKLRAFPSISRLYAAYYVHVADMTLSLDIENVGTFQIELGLEFPAEISLCMVGGTGTWSRSGKPHVTPVEPGSEQTPDQDSGDQTQDGTSGGTSGGTSDGTGAVTGQASGTLSVYGVGDENVLLNYSYSNGTDVSLFRNGALIHTFGSGSGNSSNLPYIDWDVLPDTSYTYQLRNGKTTSATLLGEVSAKTYAHCSSSGSGSSCSGSSCSGN